MVAGQVDNKINKTRIKLTLLHPDPSITNVYILTQKKTAPSLTKLNRTKPRTKLTIKSMGHLIEIPDANN